MQPFLDCGRVQPSAGDVFPASGQFLSSACSANTRLAFAGLSWPAAVEAELIRGDWTDPLLAKIGVMRIIWLCELMLRPVCGSLRAMLTR